MQKLLLLFFIFKKIKNLYSLLIIKKNCLKIYNYNSIIKNHFIKIITNQLNLTFYNSIYIIRV